MRILVVTFFYRPDLSAGAFRAPPLVDALRELAPAGSQVDVLTTSPNRYQSFAVDAPAFEREPGFSITRVALPTHRSGMRDQSRAFAAFANGGRRAVAGKRYDLVVATSGRLMTAVLGAWIARTTGARLYLDIRDIFAETIADVLPGLRGRAVKPFFSMLERWTISRAARVNLVSRGFQEYFERRYPGRTFTYLTNGIDDEFKAAAPVRSGTPHTNGGPITAVYAGNLGESQGLHAIIPMLAKRLENRVRFVLVGDGGRRDRLEAALQAARVSNVEIVPPVKRAELLEYYRKADVLFIHLHAYDVFRTVLPSKLFEYGATGKPVWAGIAGFSAQFVEAELSNAAVFPPCDVEAAVQALDRLKLQTLPRPEFVARYDRAAISRAMARDILALAKP